MTRLNRGRPELWKSKFMNNTQTFITFLLIILSTSCMAQDDVLIKTYGGNGSDRGIHIIQASDSNFVVVGNTTVEGKNLDVYLLKCNSSGDTLWTRKFGGPEDDNGWSIKETSDRGYIITGFTESYGAGKNDVLLMKTDVNGVEQWSKTFGGSGDDIGWSIAINDDGGFTIAAQTDGYGNGELDAYLIRADANGDTLWTRTFGGPKTDRVFSVALADDGSALLAGITYSYGAGDRDAWLLKTGSSGDLLWQKTYGGPGYDNAHGVIVNSENEIILTGYGDYWGNEEKRNIFLKKITMDGEDVWTQKYGGPENDRAMTVFQTQDNGYVMTGFTQSFGQGAWDAYVLRTDAAGDTLWTSTYGATAPDFGYDVIQSVQGDYFVTGWSHSFGQPEGGLLLIKIIDVTRQF